MIRSFLLLLVLTIFHKNDANNLPFKLGVRDSFMIAHSFKDNPAFGPAQNLHGATYTCDIEFCTKKLHPTNNWVIDIGKALDILSRVLKKYNFKNLDEMFLEEMTTTEFMARQIHRDLCELLRLECGEFEGCLCVKLWESHKAWASYEAEV